MRSPLRLLSCLTLGAVLSVPVFSADTPTTPVAPPAAAAKQAPTPNPNNLGNDANGNPLRRAASTGHVSNYDEAKVGNYTLPDPLVLLDGQPVRDAATWLKRRRPEIVRLYESEIYGRVPERTPRISADVVATETGALDGAAVHKHIVLKMGDAADAPKVNVHLYLPAKANGPVPVLLHLTFFTNTATPPTLTATSANAGAPAATPGPRMSEAGPVAELLARGFGYALVRYTEIEGDQVANNVSLLRKLALAPGQTKPAADDWGTVAAWSWGASRVLDYLDTDRAVDAKRVGLIGHSRLGKTVLWAAARDTRFALVFSSCAGEMGSALARRDFGESVDDMAGNFPWQFAGNLQKYVGKWNDMPVDAHMLIALSAPRPVFITGGTRDQWADPKGQFLAQVAAGPVYRLLGRKDLGTTELPPVDTPLTEGDLGFHYHTGGHTITPADWTAFLTFATRHLKP